MDRRSLPEFTFDMYPDDAERLEFHRRTLTDFFPIKGLLAGNSIINRVYKIPSIKRK